MEGQKPRTWSGIELSVQKICNNYLRPSQQRKVRKRYARIIMAEPNLYVEYSLFVDATFWPRDACFPEKRILGGDRCDGNVTQILFLEVRYFTMNAFQSGLGVNT